MMLVLAMCLGISCLSLGEMEQPREGGETPPIVKATHSERNTFGFWSASLLIRKGVKISHSLTLLWSMG